MLRERLAILGVGLLGGSVALAARAAGIVEWVSGYDPRPEALEIGVRTGILERASQQMSAAVAQASLIIVCAPVDRIADLVTEASHFCPEGALLTDVGSTKGLVRDLEGRLPTGRTFVGGHPLAGSEKSGPQNAIPDLFRERLVVLTPTEHSPPTAVERLMTFWRALGARIEIMTPEAHDRAVAWTSHLPHLLAYALAGCLPPEFLPLTASGFRDMTRLAGSDPSLWQAIFAANRSALLAALTGFRERLGVLESALEEETPERLIALLGQAKPRRDGC